MTTRLQQLQSLSSCTHLGVVKHALAASDPVARTDSGAERMIQLGDLIVILDLHRQGLSISAIARRTGRDPKTIRKYIARGLEPPAYGPRQAGRPSKLAPYLDYLRERIAAFPDLSAVRLTRELRERGYSGAYTAVKRFAAVIRPDNAPKPFEVRFETPAGKQAQVDFARFVTIFTDEPGVTRHLAVLDGARPF